MPFPDNFSPELVIESPGRINLIGEHTDYNLGYVLPTAIGKKITFKFKRNHSDKECRLYSLGYNTGFTLQLDKIARSGVEWENYILGVINEILLRTDRLRGFDCTIDSKLPMGSGLSSSAALECGLAFGLNELFDLGLSKMDIVHLSQKAEHTFVGTQCGIMDQFASVMSEKGHVILLDCKSLEHQQIPIQMEPYKMIMLNTKVSHNLASSEYNTRRRECGEAVDIIRGKYPEVRSLRDVTAIMIEEFKNTMDTTLFKRSSFIVSENERVLKAANALKANDIKLLGTLLYEAHEGISTLYEVSCPESDFLVDFSKQFDAVLGARQTGGGFGGCVLNIVHKDKVEAFVEEATKAYKEAFNIDLEAFGVQPSAGTYIHSSV
ncbi:MULTISPECIES: galactokinase [unclassified Arenibacter]|uniref:galactokinase n=1 Tax=unclassified Arenibacter TaxID=2615047 RepID=UPI000E3564E9|nr:MULTISPECIES: galactokinase [unclassified Arenibacter]MCM4163373.1 galactokinase [Arenibacter sp. A80]RFT57376.1 galactokinase [Arenibacter sp. P308M17]